MKKRTEWRKSIGRKTVPPGSLSEQVQYGKPITDMKMYPTPTATERSGTNPKTGKGAGLSKMVKMMYPTPTQDSASERTKKYKQGGKPLTVAVQEEEKKKMYPTPRASAAMNENLETVKKRVERRGKLGSKLEETIATEQPMMYPTPTVVCEEGGEQSHMVERTKSGGFVSRRKGSGITYGSKLSDAMLYLEKMYPTPTARDYKDVGYQPTWKPSRDQSMPRTVLKNNIEPGGKLNPTFVEFLMGFPMNWTKTEPTESKPSVTQSSHKSQESSDSQSKKFYPTPRANEPGKTTKGYKRKFRRGLAELMEGKEQVEPRKMKILFKPQTEWLPPEEFKDLSSYDEIAIDLETKDPNLKTMGSGSVTGQAKIVGIALAVEGWSAYYPIAHEGGGNMDRKKVIDYFRTYSKLPLKEDISQCNVRCVFY